MVVNSGEVETGHSIRVGNADNANNNSLIITGSDTVWRIGTKVANVGGLFVGVGGQNNTVTISGGAVVSKPAEVSGVEPAAEDPSAPGAGAVVTVDSFRGAVSVPIGAVMSTLSTAPIGGWVPLGGGHPILLRMEPPAECETGSLDVHVRQRSTGKSAVVEFSMDPRAMGPGCYVV